MTKDDQTRGPATDAGRDRRSGAAIRRDRGTGGGRPPGRCARQWPAPGTTLPGSGAAAGRDPGRADGRVLGHPAGHRPGGQAEQGLQPLVPGGRGAAAGAGCLSRPRDRPALPVHVSPFGRGDARVHEPAGQARDDARAGPGALGGLDRGDRPVGLAGDRRQGQGAAPAPLRRPLALHHRPDPQHVPAGPAEPVAPDAAAGGLRLPADGREAGPGCSWPRPRRSRRSRSWPWATSSTAGCGGASFATVAALPSGCWSSPCPSARPPRPSTTVQVWSQGMLFTYNSHGIAQRPYRSFSYKNQSIMAMAHRLLRDVPADGEKVLSQHAAEHGRRASRCRACSPTARSTWPRCSPRSPAEAPRWDDRFEGVERRPRRRPGGSTSPRSISGPSRSSPWRPCSASRSSSLAVFPRPGAAPPRTDAVEFALVTLLIVMFSPLSFNYAYVWLIYPITVALAPGPGHDPADRPLAEARARLDRRDPPHPRPGRLRCPSTPRPTATSSCPRSCWCSACRCGCGRCGRGDVQPRSQTAPSIPRRLTRQVALARELAIALIGRRSTGPRQRRARRPIS